MFVRRKQRSGILFFDSSEGQGDVRILGDRPVDVLFCFAATRPWCPYIRDLGSTGEFGMLCLQFIVDSDEF